MEANEPVNPVKYWYWIYSREGELIGGCTGQCPQAVRVPAPIYAMGPVPHGGYPEYKTELLLVDFEPFDQLGNRELTGAYLIDAAYHQVAELPSGRLCKLYSGPEAGNWVLRPFDQGLYVKWLGSREPVWSLFKHKLRKRDNG